MSRDIVKATSRGKRYYNGEEVSRGLGDTIAKATKAVGIKPCGGCKKRQQWLNEKVPYRTKASPQRAPRGTEKGKFYGFEPKTKNRL